MSNATTKTFDAVLTVRTVRDAVSSTIATMSVDEENRWLQSGQFSDPKLRHLMDLAAQQDAAAARAAAEGERGSA